MGYRGNKGWYMQMMGAAKAKMRIKNMTKQMGEGLPDAFLRGGAIVARRAKQILDEKDHVLTGTLKGSIHPEVLDWRKDQIEIGVGPWVVYARKIENLPDGGYLFESFETTRVRVVQSIKASIKQIVQRNVGR